MNNEMFIAYVLPVLAAFITGMAGYIGTQFKKLYEKYVNTKVKKDVANTCVKAVEQLYHDLGGPEKFKKAQEAIEEMLNEKGIPITELEMNLLIESVVSEFNYGFAKASEVSGLDIPSLVTELEESETELVYSEEGGSR